MAISKMTQRWIDPFLWHFTVAEILFLLALLVIDVLTNYDD